mmetsp:Transcript_30095/g.77638  ORF Transcript_30095/g.77638 Transcript_30095/m.77638 type:complete len:323 (-) Transcript_30095:56-1024(-)
MIDGSVEFRLASTLELLLIDRDRNEKGSLLSVAATRLRFSPNREMLAVGRESGLVDVYTIANSNRVGTASSMLSADGPQQQVKLRQEDTRDIPILTIRRKLSSVDSSISSNPNLELGKNTALRSFDWSADSRVLQFWVSGLGTPRHLYLDITIPSYLSPVDVRDVVFQSWSLPGGWPLHGINPSLRSVISRVERSPDGRSIAVGMGLAGESLGLVRIFRYPCVTSAAASANRNQLKATPFGRSAAGMRSTSAGEASRQRSIEREQSNGGGAGDGVAVTRPRSRVYAGHGDAISDMCYSHDGGYFLSGGIGDGAIIQWMRATR